MDESVGNAELDENDEVESKSNKDLATKFKQKLSVTFTSAQIYEYTVADDEHDMDDDTKDFDFEDYYRR